MLVSIPVVFKKIETTQGAEVPLNLDTDDFLPLGPLVRGDQVKWFLVDGATFDGIDGCGVLLHTAFEHGGYG